MLFYINTVVWWQAKSNTQWRVEPAEGEISPEGQLELTLVAHLDDALPFQDKLQLAIHGSQTRIVTLWAMGKGTTIVTDQPFAPHLDLGTHFRYSVKYKLYLFQFF